MPDYSVTTCDPFQRARTVAAARYGRYSGWLVTGLVCFLSSLIALVIVENFATQANAEILLNAAFVPVGLATLAAFYSERSRQKKRSRLIDELWQTYAAQASEARSSPVRTPRTALTSIERRSAQIGSV